MLKFAAIAKDNPAMHYANSVFCEHLGSRIFESLGFLAQQTDIGTYNRKLVVACNDFVGEGKVFRDFAHLKNSMIDSEHNGYGTELSEILETVQAQQLVDPEALEQHFWRMFVADALLGNFDRHNGNWGFLINEHVGSAEIAPIFDCGSWLYPKLTDEQMKNILQTPEEIDKRLYVFPNSAIRVRGQKINYWHFLRHAASPKIREALDYVLHRYDRSAVIRIIESAPLMSDGHRVFAYTMLEQRREKYWSQLYRKIDYGGKHFIPQRGVKNILCRQIYLSTRPTRSEKTIKLIDRFFLFAYTQIERRDRHVTYGERKSKWTKVSKKEWNVHVRRWVFR